MRVAGLNSISPQVDFKKLIDLADEFGEFDFIVRLVDLFEEQASTRILGMERAIQQLSCRSLMYEAHTFESSCAHVGAVRMRELCRQLENMGRENTLNGAIELLDSLKAEFHDVLQQLHAFLRRINQ